MNRIGMIALLLVLPAGLAWPQEEPPMAEDRALTMFERAQGLYGEGRYQEALGLLVEAHALKADAVLMYNIALCQEQLGRWRQAMEAYGQYLERDPGGKRGGEVREKLKELSRRLRAEVELSSTPPGAQVLVDGQVRGMTPCVVELPPGRHELTVARKGYTSEVMAIEAKEGERLTVAPILLPAPQAVGSGEPEVSPWKPQAPTWVLLVAGAVSLAVGGALGGLASLKMSDAEDMWRGDAPMNLTNLHQMEDLQGGAQSFALGANILYVSGGALLTSGLAVWLAQGIGGGASRPVEADSARLPPPPRKAPAVAKAD